MPTIQLEAYLTGVRLTSDGCASLSFHSQEIKKDADWLAIKSLHQTQGWLLFRPTEWKESEVPADNPPTKGETPSQQLRNLIWVLYKKRGETGSSDDFYKNKMNSLKAIIQNQIAELD